MVASPVVAQQERREVDRLAGVEIAVFLEQEQRFVEAFGAPVGVGFVARQTGGELAPAAAVLGATVSMQG